MLTLVHKSIRTQKYQSSVTKTSVPDIELKGTIRIRIPEYEFQFSKGVDPNPDLDRTLRDCAL